MVSVIEPITAGLVVALINKFVINNNSLWDIWCSSHVVDDAEDASSSTTSINDYVHAHVHF